MPALPTYREMIVPVPAIDALWATEVPFAGEGTQWPHRVLPDGCIDLILRYLRAENGGTHAPRLLVAGPTVTFDQIRLDAGAVFLGVRFRPGWGGRCLEVAARSLVGQVVDAADVNPRLVAIADRLDLLAPAAAVRIAFFRAALGLAETAGRPGRPQEAARRLHLTHGRADLRGLAATLEMSSRTLRREVTTAVGIGPKPLARVFRFRHALAQLGDAPEQALADLAAATGFADQAHMTREFRAIGGFTPGSHAAFSGRNLQDRPGLAC